MRCIQFFLHQTRLLAVQGDKDKLEPFNCLRASVDATLSRKGFNFVKRGLEIDPICSRCGSSVEYPLHALVICEEARKLWYCSPLRLCTENVGDVSFKDWVRGLLQIYTDQEWWNLLWSVAWAIWTSPNRWTCKGKDRGLQYYISRAVSLVWEYQQALEALSLKGSRILHNEHWFAPPQGIYKINSDADLLDGKIGMGVIRRDCEGDVLVARCGAIEGCWDCNCFGGWIIKDCDGKG